MMMLVILVMKRPKDVACSSSCCLTVFVAGPFSMKSMNCGLGYMCIKKIKKYGVTHFGSNAMEGA